MPRTMFLLGCGLVAVALAFLLTDALLWKSGVTEANVRRIRPGMTLKEVEALLGGPGSLSVYVIEPTGEVTSRTRCWYVKEWGPMRASVRFNAHDRAEETSFGSHDYLPAAKSSLFANLRAWLGW